ncbi:unnamed protein product [Bursaphelenchus xylophilus]|uniref:(pine wood nematode) hypothetical protein n=1 Tax=Bursaphelenchus xylophilus TaxID=6326 RepID=A0A1I7SL42_BURXY|nr:unnamed protein product [Bursaphelenchus xylophilus]CAG9129361.1 unnamed protein product [Bursaphelenchus xylophilus]
MQEYCASKMHFNFLRETCPYTCQQCHNDCKDNVACEAIKRIGGCDRTTTRYDWGIIQRWCPRSCGLCKDKNRDPNKKQKEAEDKKKAQDAKKKAAEDAKKKAVEDARKRDEEAKKKAEGKRKAAEEAKKKAKEGKKKEEKSKNCESSSDLVYVDMPNFDKLIKQKGDWNIEETTCIDGIKFRVIPRKTACGQPDGCLQAAVVASDDRSAKWATAAEVTFYVINSDPLKTIEVGREATLSQDAKSLDGDILAPLDDLVDGNRGFIRDNTVTVLVKIVLSEVKGG